MILSGPEILRQVEIGTLVINPYNPAQLNPNSYDLTLGDTLLQAFDEQLDVTKPMSNVREFKLTSKGHVLYPNTLYLGHTSEWTEAHGYVAILHGKSSLARYGLQVHATAGFGDDGFCGRWTLEISVIHKPVTIYPGIRICQLCYSPVLGTRQPYKGRYQHQHGAQPGRLWLDYLNDNVGTPTPIPIPVQQVVKG